MTEQANPNDPEILRHLTPGSRAAIEMYNLDLAERRIRLAQVPGPVEPDVAAERAEADRIWEITRGAAA